MRVIALFVFMLFSFQVAAADDHLGDQGGCDKYPWDMNREWSLMITDQFPLKSYAVADPEARYIPLDRRVLFALHPSDQVKLPAATEKKHAGSTYAGMARIQLPFQKKYRISSNKPVWIDVVGPNGIVPATKFAMMMGCEKLVKTVIFKLENEVDYWLQITGSADAQVELLVTLDR